MGVFDSAEILKLFKKVNKRIDELICQIEDLYDRTIINVGLGVGIFRRLYKNKYELKSLVGGTNVTITSTDTEITISASGGGGSFACSDLNSCDTDELPEGATNLYFTNPRAVSALTGQNISLFLNDVGYLTSASAAATYVPLSRNITINGTTFDLSADRTWNVGTVTSIGLTAGTGISLAGTNPVTSSGSITVTNSAPDQTVVLTAGSGISIISAYPNFTISTTGGSGTVTSFSSGDLSPLFTTSVATATTTPALSFALSNASANTWYGNNTGGATTPSFNSSGALSKVDDTNVTLTLSAGATNALLNATSLTLGWTGQLALSRGGTGANLVDPNADRIMFWDDSLGQVTWLAPANSITISGTDLQLSGDEASPGNLEYYGTNSSGTKGFYETQSTDSIICLDQDNTDRAVAAATTTQTKVYSYLFNASNSVVAKRIKVGDVIVIEASYYCATSNSMTLDIYLNSADSIGGTHVFTYTSGGSLRGAGITRHIYVQSALNTSFTMVNNASSSNTVTIDSGFATGSALFTALSDDFATDLYLIFALTKATTANAVNLKHTCIKIQRSV